MNRFDAQTSIDISGTTFPKLVHTGGNSAERFWYVKEEFLIHSEKLLNEGKMFSQIDARNVNNRWLCVGNPISNMDISWFVGKMRLFYMKSESMSIYSLCTYMESNINNIKVRMFFRHMRESWEEYLNREATLIGNYSGPVKTNKQLIDALLYCGNFHSQEKHKKRYDNLLKYMDESLMLNLAYNAMHSSYQMHQISRSIKELREDNLVILLPNHLQHEWDENCPYEVASPHT